MCVLCMRPKISKHTALPGYFTQIFKKIFTELKRCKKQPYLLTSHDGLCPEDRVLSGEKRSDSHPAEDHFKMKIRQIFRSISDPGAFIIQQVTWMGELKFQHIGSDLYSRIKWLQNSNLTSWSLRKIGVNQPQRHLLHSFHVCSQYYTKTASVFSHFL